MRDIILTVKNLKVDIPVGGGELHAVRNISFELSKGETLCIVGESGSGKSLTSLALMDLLPKKACKSANVLNFAGENLLNKNNKMMRKIRGKRMSMIFQEPMTSLNPSYTIGNQLIESLQLHQKVSYEKAKQRALDILEKVGISAAQSRLSQYPHQLSGGLRQRIMIAMALMGEPELIIADEPTTALDVTIQAQILRLLIDIQKQTNVALIFITHDLGLVSRIADKIAVMYAGEIVEYGDAKDIFNSPKHPYTLGLLNCIPVPGKTKKGELLGVIPGIVPSLIGELQGCVFRQRCKYSKPQCSQNIALQKSSSTHHYKCILDNSLKETSM